MAKEILSRCKCEHATLLFNSPRLPPLQFRTCVPVPKAITLPFLQTHHSYHCRSAPGALIAGLFLEHVNHPLPFHTCSFFFFLECSSLHISSRFVLYHQRGISYPHHLSNRMLPTFLLFILLDFFSPFISISIPDIMICICLVVYMMSPPTRMSTFREQEFCMFYSLLHLIV